jgi:hypothetical protein
MTARKANDRPDRRSRITARLRKALDLMCWGDADGNPLDWDDAARTANISTRSMRRSLERPNVRQYLQEQKQVLRACISGKSLSRLDELAAQRTNMNAAVNAIRAIDEADATSAQLGQSHTPGVIIRIVNQVPPPLDRTPPPLTIEHESAAPTQPRRDERGDPVFVDPTRRSHDP